MICTVTTSITALLLTAATCADDGARHSARCNLHTCATSIHTIVHANSRLLDAAGNSERVDEEGRREKKRRKKRRQDNTLQSITYVVKGCWITTCALYRRALERSTNVCVEHRPRRDGVGEFRKLFSPANERSRKVKET